MYGCKWGRFRNFFQMPASYRLDLAADKLIGRVFPIQTILPIGCNFQGLLSLKFVNKLLIILIPLDRS